ncbi:hypothetical protein CP10139811_0199 [Chlamydia ibidis]|uniref:Uncharacterized protein n=2 Tax=Chlamydia ibidis TaxID=1405396 RepID=S7J523_9CHLA|nr:hypothetical protein CP10139811_0199 [Chlamydia ibidis]EQM62714.1 hypothetical protein H359_0644 [Chlamydia ibidis 10-1398/6]
MPELSNLVLGGTGFFQRLICYHSCLYCLGGMLVLKRILGLA